MFVFISYSKPDKEFTKRICGILDKQNINYFLDQKSMEWGENIDQVIHDAFEKATHLLVIISPASLKSQWVAYEIGIAKTKELTILPLLIHPSLELPTFISQYHYLTSLEQAKKYFSKIDSKLQNNVEKKVVSKFITFLENKRVLYGELHEGCPGGAIESVHEIRERIQLIMEPLERNSYFYNLLAEMRKATMNFFKFTCGDCKTPMTCKDCEIDKLDKIGCRDALIKLRNSMGIQIGNICTTFKIDVDEKLATILPKKM